LYTEIKILQILSIYDEKLGDQETEKVVSYIKSLQQPSGSFVGDKWGEEDTRFSFCAVASLTLIVSCCEE
jgi:geranylgeranyl transferase type-2 subunit beta